MRAKEIGRFLKSLDTAERIYLDHCLRISNSIKNLIDQTQAPKEQVCSRFKISVRRYNDFICGNYNYDLYHTAVLNAWWYAVETEKLKDRVPVRVPELENSSKS